MTATIITESVCNFRELYKWNPWNSLMEVVARLAPHKDKKVFGNPVRHSMLFHNFINVFFGGSLI